MILLLIDDPNQTLQKSRMGQWNFRLRQLLLLPLHGLVTTYTHIKAIQKTISAMSKRFFCKKMIIAMPGQMSVKHHVSVCPILMEYFLHLIDLFLLNTDIQNIF